MRAVLLAALLGAACAPARPPATGPEAAADTGSRMLLRPVPVPGDFRTALERGTRTPTGAPGPRYWQQRVGYHIEAELDPQTALLRGRERIVYHNRSPHPLSSIVLNLYQNVFSEGVPRNRFAPITGGVTLERVAAQGRALSALQPREICARVAAARCVIEEPREGAPTGYAVQGTLARLILPRAVAPGDSAVLEVAWRHRVPPTGAFRTAWEDALGGRVLQVAQWYPQVAVFDDVRGWDATPYLGEGEFYLEYGDFDVSLTLPAGWLVGATGVLQNAEEVLTPEARARLDAALEADTVVGVVTEADLRAGTATRASAGRLTWRFRAEDVRDFAFATSNRYVWEVARADVPGEGGEVRRVPVHTLYRPGAPGWERAAGYGEHATEFFSRLLIPYLYPQITVSEGPIYGMEYPQLVFIARPTEAEDLYAVIAHEIGHEWFPMMVGQDEAAFAWMDEGFTTFHEDSARTVYFPGSDAFAETRAAYLRVAGREAEVPLMRHTDLVSPYGARTVAAYSKPGVLLRSLRAVVGDTVFARAMRTYAREWLLKHPYPWDFFNTVERVAGRDLDWFWYPWWHETGTLDYAIERVDASEPGSVTITLRDLGEVPAPVVVSVTSDNGAETRLEVPIESWTVDRYRSVPVTVPVSGRPVRVEVDPGQLFPDVNRENNVWTAPGS
jgi:hypothetical protein